eukprot:803289-Rhodomonas_salina.1
MNQWCKSEGSGGGGAVGRRCALRGGGLWEWIEEEKGRRDQDEEAGLRVAEGPGADVEGRDGDGWEGGRRGFGVREWPPGSETRTWWERAEGSTERVSVQRVDRQVKGGGEASATVKSESLVRFQQDQRSGLEWRSVRSRGSGGGVTWVGERRREAARRRAAQS